MNVSEQMQAIADCLALLFFHLWLVPESGYPKLPSKGLLQARGPNDPLPCPKRSDATVSTARPMRCLLPWKAMLLFWRPRPQSCASGICGLLLNHQAYA